MKLPRLLLVFLLFAAISGHSQETLKQMRSDVRQTIDGKEYFIHSVKRGQTLYMISKAYGVDVNEVIRENPQVKEGLNTDMKLRIPVPEGMRTPKKVPKEEMPSLPPSSDKPAVKELQEEQSHPPLLPCGEDRTTRQATYTVALMLPLFLNQVSAMDAMNPPDDPEASYAPLKFVQFYEGFIFALDSIAKTGMKVKVVVADIGKDTSQTARILKDPEFRNLDLIIGFLYPANFKIVAEFARKNGINIINPLSERDEVIKGNPHVFKVRAGPSSQTTNLVSLLKRDFPGAGIVILAPASYNKTQVEGVKTACLEAGYPVELVSTAAAATEKLKADSQNVVIAFAETKSAALDIITKLNEKRSEFKLTVIGWPRWDKLDDLEADYLVNLKTHLFSPGFVDLQEEPVRKFALKYQEKYGAIPDDLAYQGFDTGLYFLNALFQFGKNFERCIPDFSMQLLSMKFRFQATDGNGFENTDWAIYRYENYRTVAADR